SLPAILLPIQSAQARVGDAGRGGKRVAGHQAVATLAHSGRTSLSGSSTGLDSSLNTMVVRLSAVYGAQSALPVRANVAQVFDTLSATAWSPGLRCRSPITPSVSNTNGTSIEWQDLSLPSKAGVSQANSYIQTGALARAALRSASKVPRTPKLEAVVAVISRSAGLAAGLQQA